MIPTSPKPIFTIFTSTPPIKASSKTICRNENNPPAKSQKTLKMDQPFVDCLFQFQ